MEIGEPGDELQSIPTVQDALLTPCSRWHVLGTRTSHPTVLSLSEGCNIKQKLNVSYGLKCILKTSYSFFLFFQLTNFIPCVLSVIPLYSQTFYFPVASALVLVPTDLTEKEKRKLITSFLSRGCNQLHPGKCGVTEGLPTCPWGAVDLHSRE